MKEQEDYTKKTKTTLNSYVDPLVGSGFAPFTGEMRSTVNMVKLLVLLSCVCVLAADAQRSGGRKRQNAEHGRTVDCVFL
jgi:hypothetical protein